MWKRIAAWMFKLIRFGMTLSNERHWCEARLLFLVLFFPLLTSAQTVTTDPVFPRADQPVTISIDVSGTSLNGFAWNNTTNPVWIWTWIKNGSITTDAPTNVNPATSPAQDAAKCARTNTNPDIYRITFTPTTFFNKPASEIKQIGLKLKTKDWSDNKQTDNDRYITFYEGFEAFFIKPAEDLIFKDPGAQVEIQLNATENSDMVVKINNTTVASTTTAGSVLNYSHTVSEAPGSLVTVIGEAQRNLEIKKDTFTYIVRTPTQTSARPTGIRDGINYNPTDNSTVTLGLWVPGKTSVYVTGDFNDWTINPSYLMKKDGEHFWLTLSGLTAGQEYAFQYLVDETIYMADPYADKILDPDDQHIPEIIYPGLKAFPQKALKDSWYFNRASVFQTDQQSYSWQATDFQKPGKEKLVIYELLIRDFFGSNDRSYKNLMDTVSYLKRLGVNAVELMPIMEFSGNESWGYNPTFMFAPDKYYGTKNQLKAFIDKCHQNGIAVIFDITMNHHDIPNPYVLMDFDFASFKPKATNKWFNVNATHPYNVFFDMNHESSYTKTYLDTVNYYWLNEYHIDGYRFDLSKGFTQKNSGSNVSSWSARDESRIAILKRMADKIWSHSANAYVILEHFADNSEEKELAEYRSGEGKGMMLWGNLNHAYNQNTMGVAAGSDISWIYHGTRSWTVPHAVGYMESHDEERLMYKNIQSGGSAGSYNVKDLNTALARIKAAAVMFYTIPGPKMLWEFGELGYDQSINRCENGTINDGCRVSPKPVKWEYLANDARHNLFTHTAELIKLRSTYDIFTSGEATLQGGNTLLKQITLKNKPYTTSPSSADDMNVQVVTNFNLTSQSVTVNFPHTGVWYDFYANGQPVFVSDSPFTIMLSPGEYKLFMDYSLHGAPVTGIINEAGNQVMMYPIPVDQIFHVNVVDERVEQLIFWSLQGSKINPLRLDDKTWSTDILSSGFYIVEIRTNHKTHWSKLIKK